MEEAEAVAGNGISEAEGQWGAGAVRGHGDGAAAGSGWPGDRCDVRSPPPRVEDLEEAAAAAVPHAPREPRLPLETAARQGAAAADAEGAVRWEAQVWVGVELKPRRACEAAVGLAAAGVDLEAAAAAAAV